MKVALFTVFWYHLHRSGIESETPKNIRVLWNGEETFGVSVDYQTEDGRRICWEGTTERPKKITERIVIFQL